MYQAFIEHNLKGANSLKRNLPLGLFQGIAATVCSIFVYSGGNFLKTLRAALAATVPVMAGYVFLGAGFGILLAKSGYGPLWALLMSITMYAGSMQYVAVSILSAAFDPLATALITLTVNARHLFYGLSMLVPFSTAGKYKPYMIFSLTDETFSLLCQTKAPDGIDENKYRFLISLSNHLSWIFGCTAGNILGGFIPPELKGVEFVMTAFFVVIMAEQWLTAKTKLPALAGLAVSVLCLLVFGAESFIIPAMLGILLALVLLKPAILKGGLRLD